MKKNKSLTLIMALVMGLASAAMGADKSDIGVLSDNKPDGKNVNLGASDEYLYLKDYTWRRIGENAIAPFIESSGQVALISGGFLTSSLLVTRHQTSYALQESWSQSKPLGESARIGDIMGQTVPNAIYALGMLLHYGLSDDEESYYRSLYMIEATLFSSLLTTALKYSLREERPSGVDNKSFPSGHTTTAFAFATVIAEEHSIYYAIPAYVLATFVGLSRINDNAHYLHDVVFGASIGIAYGLSLSKLNFTRGKKDFPGTTTVRLWLTPVDNGEGLIVGLKGIF